VLVVTGAAAAFLLPELQQTEGDGKKEWSSPSQAAFGIVLHRFE